MKMVIRSRTAVAAAVLLLSGCGPAVHDPATSIGNSGSSLSSADAAQTPSPAATPTPTTTLSPVVAPVATAAPATPPTSSTPKPVSAGTALAGVARLVVKGRADKTGYTRGQFGQAWFDTDRNGCDTRNDILRRDLVSRQMNNACKVLVGTLAPDPYTGTSIRFVYGGASEVDVDHLVALSDAWQKGAATQPAGSPSTYPSRPDVGPLVPQPACSKSATRSRSARRRGSHFSTSMVCRQERTDLR